MQVTPIYSMVGILGNPFKSEIKVFFSRDVSASRIKINLQTLWLTKSFYLTVQENLFKDENSL